MDCSLGTRHIHNVPYNLADNRFSIKYNDEIKPLPKGSFLYTDKRCPGIVPQSDPVPGVYYFRSYDLSSIIEGDFGDESTGGEIADGDSSLRTYKIVIPPEFSDYVSVDLSVVTLYSSEIPGRYHAIISTGNYKDKDGYDTYIEIYPQVAMRLDSLKYDTICSTK